MSDQFLAWLKNISTRIRCWRHLSSSGYQRFTL